MRWHRTPTAGDKMMCQRALQKGAYCKYAKAHNVEGPPQKGITVDKRHQSFEILQNPGVGNVGH